jgi:hypothetical protein
VEAGEEVSAIQLQGFGWLSGVEKLLEREDVAVEPSISKPELVAGRGEDVVADDAPQIVKRLAERAAAFLFAQLRPEQREQRVSANGGASGEGEVREQRDALGLGASGSGLGGPGNESDSAECEKLAHDLG